MQFRKKKSEKKILPIINVNTEELARSVFREFGTEILWHNLGREYKNETQKLPPLEYSRFMYKKGEPLSHEDMEQRTYNFREWLQKRYPNLNTDWECSFSFDFDVKAACLIHDLCYKLGGSKENKKDADRFIHWWIMERAKQRPWWMWPGYKIVAWHRYFFPSMLGNAIGAFKLEDQES